MILTTERLLLRPWKETDAESLYQYAKNPDVGPIAGWPSHKSVEESRGVIKDYFCGKECYAVCLKTDEIAIGCIELKLNGKTDMTEQDDECELGYWIGKEFWGQGLIPEAACEMLRHAFDDLNMSTVWCGYYDGNNRSKHVQEKVGFLYHHTCNDVPVPLMGETRVGHTNYMTKEHYLEVLTKEDRILPPWADELTEGEFISYSATYQVGKYFDLYEKDVYLCETTGDLTYYFYDPTKHGYPTDRKYPLLIFMHGFTNALEGDVCINYSGAELYASPDYQQSMEGAYVLIPIANEKRQEDGEVIDSWSQVYVEPVLQLIKEFDAKRSKTIGKKFVFGNSNGATFCQLVTEADPKYINACIPIGSGYIPSDEALDAFDANDVHYFFALSLHDEFHNYEEVIVPRLPRLQKMKHFFPYFPKWTYNGDGGIASINFGVEMGQHCLINTMQANLILDDKTALDERLPEGVTGWIRKVCEESDI